MGIVFFACQYYYLCGIYAGARSCIGRFFFFKNLQSKYSDDQLFFFRLLIDSPTEAIAVLSILVSQFKTTIKEKPQFSGERSARLGLTSIDVGL